MNEVFPELRRLEAQPTKMLLRSHITSAWFLTCLAVQHKLEMPVKLFCVGLRARREQQEDASHLRFHNAASSVIMDDEVSVDDGRAVAELVRREARLPGGQDGAEEGHASTTRLGRSTRSSRGRRRRGGSS